jgi:hypothetical protein
MTERSGVSGPETALPRHFFVGLLDFMIVDRFPKAGADRLGVI